MEGILNKIITKEFVKPAVFDLIALTAIYFVPVFSHLFAVPIYYAEPMRLMLVLSIMFTSKKNVMLIAFTMPLFSMLVSGHPVFYKALIMSGELLLNVILYFVLVERVKNKFTSMILSITLSKVAYYGLKILLLQLALMSGDLIATPVVFQLGVIFVYSLLIMLKKEQI
jgi:hypothetical protein